MFTLQFLFLCRVCACVPVACRAFRRESTLRLRPLTSLALGSLLVLWGQVCLPKPADDRSWWRVAPDLEAASSASGATLELAVALSRGEEAGRPACDSLRAGAWGLPCSSAASALERSPRPERRVRVPAAPASRPFAWLCHWSSGLCLVEGAARGAPGCSFRGVVGVGAAGSEDLLLRRLKPLCGLDGALGGGRPTLPRSVGNPGGLRALPEDLAGTENGDEAPELPAASRAPAGGVGTSRPRVSAAWEGQGGFIGR